MIDTEVLRLPITIGVVADTHLRSGSARLPDELLNGIAGVDMIFHAGDVNTEDVLRRFEDIAPVRAVVGNNDDQQLQQDLPFVRLFRAGRFTIVLLHGHNSLKLSARKFAEKLWADRVDLVIFGHSHQALKERIGGCLLFNPGSPTQRRWQPSHSFGIIRIDDEIEAELHFF